MPNPRPTLPAELREAFDRQIDLCDTLEAIADSLPDRLDRHQCLRASRLLEPVVRQAHAVEEKYLFPQILEFHADGAGIVERLRLEHVEDECFAEEVQFELSQIGKGGPVLAPETTGYMLRGFFEGLRRHVRHEEELLRLEREPPARS